MEPLSIILDDGSGNKFDAEIANARAANLPECGNMSVITKGGGTAGGAPAVMIAFDIMDNGERKRVQAVTTARLFLMAARAVSAKYPGLLD